MFKTIIFFLFLMSISLKAQNLKDEIYNFLKNQNFKGNIFFPSELNNYSFGDYSILIKNLYSKKGLLNEYERYYLDIYKNFLENIENIQRTDTLIKFLNFNQYLYLFKYKDQNFSILFNPLLIIEFSNYYKENLYIRRNGFFVFGNISGDIFYYVVFKDNFEKGKNLDKTKRYTKEKGVIITKSSSNSIEYDDIDGAISYYWKYGEFSLAKENIKIGSGNFGNIILSDKFPSFPYFSFEFMPTNWLRFYYLHGLLKSNIVDSSTIRYDPLSNRYSMMDIPKFFVLHTVSLYPTNEISFLLGESIVYSERFQPIYLIPVLFFRSVDHYLSQNLGSSTGNAQIFVDISYLNRSIKSKLYSTLFIDEMSISSLFKSKKNIAYGWTIGLESRNLLLPIDYAVLEYTRVSPFVYMNSVAAQEYSTNNIKMGHWIESNSVIYSLSYGGYFLKNLFLSLDLWYFKKGKTETTAEQYSNLYPPTLYGAKRKETGLGLNIRYYLLSNMAIKFEYLYNNITDEETNRTYEFKKGKNSNFNISLSLSY